MENMIAGTVISGVFLLVLSAGLSAAADNEEEKTFLQNLIIVWLMLGVAGFVAFSWTKHHYENQSPGHLINEATEAQVELNEHLERAIELTNELKETENARIDAEPE